MCSILVVVAGVAAEETGRMCNTATSHRYHNVACTYHFCLVSKIHLSFHYPECLPPWHGLVYASFQTQTYKTEQNNPLTRVCAYDSQRWEG